MVMNSDWILESIRRGVQQKIDKAVETEVPVLVNRIKGIVAKEMDALALSLLSNYNVCQMQNEIVIKVKKPEILK